MSEDLQNQGLTQDGTPPEPSKPEEGKIPVPSQEDIDQVTNQELEKMLPDQDERGVPKENVLGELRRKMDEMMKDLSNIKSQAYQPQQQYQQPIPQQPYQQPQPSQQVIPKTPEEIAEIVDKESREKFGEAFNNGTANYWEIRKFENKRFAELNRAMMSTVNSIQAERSNSISRIMNIYPDLGNPQSQLSQGVLNELNRRAFVRGVTPQSLYEQDPYVLESIAPMVASQYGIGAKTQGPKIQPRSNNSLPPQDFQGKQTIAKEDNKPTQADINFGKRFNVKPKTLADIRKNSPNPKEFIDESNILLS